MKENKNSLSRIRINSNEEMSFSFWSKRFLNKFHFSKFPTDPSSMGCSLEFHVSSCSWQVRNPKVFIKNILEEVSPVPINLSRYLALFIMRLCIQSDKIRTQRNADKDCLPQKGNLSKDYRKRLLCRQNHLLITHMGHQYFKCEAHLHNFLSNLVINLPDLSFQIPDHLAQNLLQLINLNEDTPCSSLLPIKVKNSFTPQNFAFWGWISFLCCHLRTAKWLFHSRVVLGHYPDVSTGKIHMPKG